MFLQNLCLLLNILTYVPFKLHRGLGQGDPLSPFLFNLVVEALNLVIRKATSKGLWEGIEVVPNGTKITHLQYADDTIIFCPPNMEFLLNIKKVLILFQMVSGLQVNFHKSSLMGIHTDDPWLHSAASSLLCKVGSLPFTYLGLPIGGNVSKIDSWAPIINRIERKLATWKGRLLSLAGRITLIKASISSLPLYYMSIFPIPKGVVEKINKLQRQFLWCRAPGKQSMALVSWAVVELPKILGGLNCGNLLTRNMGLLFKWAWRFINEPKALWRKVICEKYGYSPSFQIQALTVPNQGGPWRHICANILKHPVARNLLQTKIMRKVGNGAIALFWHEFWIGSGPLAKAFPRLFALSSQPNGTISSFGYWAGSSWTWNFQWKRDLRPRDEAELVGLQALLHTVCLSIDNDDTFIWCQSKRGEFSVKSFTRELSKSLHHPDPCPANLKKLWCGLIPPRIEIFTWCALLGKINSRAKLMMLNILPPSDACCIFCNSCIETSDHLLLHCEFAIEIWNWWLNMWEIQWAFPGRLRDAFDQWAIHGKSPFF